MDGVAWGELSDRVDDEDLPVCEASELIEAGDTAGAWKLLMATLLRDLRCIDAHAHLGLIEFEHWPQRARVHYEIGVQIGDLSLPQGFDGALLWGHINNRPFLRCLHGLGLCHWRLGRTQEAMAIFERILALNPNDNQGIRFLRESLLKGEAWEECEEEDLAEG